MILIQIVTFLLCPLSLMAQTSHNHSSTIYTQKVVRIVNAQNVGDFATERDYLIHLQKACGHNSCNPVERKAVDIVGREIVACKLKHLKSHNIVNSDANNICGAKQVMLACDTLATPLLRRMCYIGNGYSLAIHMQKEKMIQNKKRMPASIKK